jgi:hypothetical protein
MSRTNFSDFTASLREKDEPPSDLAADQSMASLELSASNLIDRQSRANFEMSGEA